MTTLSELLRRMRGALRGRVRLVLTAGLALSLMLGGTYAIWTDDATATTGEFKAGTLDLKLSNNAGGPQSENYPVTVDMWPGQTKIETVRVHNAGTLPYKLTMAVDPSGVTAGFGANKIGVSVDGVAATATPLAPGEYRDVPVTISFPWSAVTAYEGANSLQGRSGAVVLTFTANQV